MGLTAIDAGWLGLADAPATLTCPAGITTEPNTELMGITYTGIRLCQLAAETNELR